MQALVFLALGVAILTVVFAFQNNAPTSIQLFAWKFEGSLALVILVAVLAGALTSFLASLPSILRLKWQLRACRKTLAERERAAAAPPPSTPRPVPPVPPQGGGP